MTQFACWPTLSSHVTSNFKTKVQCVPDCTQRYDILYSAQHQEKDTYMSELSCSTLLLTYLSPKPVTPERLLQLMLQQHYSLFFALMCLLGNFSEKKQHRNAYAQGLLSEKGNFSSASYYISHPVERTFAADRTNVKTLTHRWHYLRRKGNATIF